MFRVKTFYGLVVFVCALMLLSTIPAHAARVLLLEDAPGTESDTLVTALQNAGHTVTTYTPEYTYALSPPLSNFDVVVHIDGQTYFASMPVATQEALVQFVRAGGGFVGTQWDGYEEAAGQQINMFDIVLMGWGSTQLSCPACTMTVVPGQEGHPVLAGIPASFSVGLSFWDLTPKVFAVNPPTTLMQISNGFSLGSAVLVRQVGAGRVVNIAAADNYASFAAAASTPLIAQLYVNAVNWAAGHTNSAPTAAIAPPAAVHAGETVTLDGSGSSDPDGNALTYHWTLAPPAGSAAVLSDPTAVMPTFTADIPGDYGVQLIVNDGTVDSAPATATVSSRNGAPSADAGPDQLLVLDGTAVQLDGTASSDPDGDALGYAWMLVSRPPGSAAVLDTPGAATAHFTADINGTYVATLQVTDPFGATSGDEVTVSFNNLAPVADAGADQAAVAGHAVTAHGNAADGNGDPLTYRWSLLSVPAGSLATLAGDTTLSPSFSADVAGTYVLQLIANDGIVDSVPDTATVEAITAQDAATQTIQELIAYLNGLPTVDSQGKKVFKFRSARRALVRELLGALRLIERRNYSAALQLLSHGVKRAMDGCAVQGSADRNDWLRPCAEQSPAYGLLTEAIGYLAEVPGRPPRRDRDHRHNAHRDDDARDRDGRRR